MGRGHDYISVVAKLTDSGPVVDFIGDGREQQALDPFWDARSPESLSAIGCAGMDIWKPHIGSVAPRLPAGRQAIAHDPLHVVQHMNKAVDAARRVARMPEKHLPQALNFFRFRVTDAYSEGVNSIIQALVKRANGYRSRECLKGNIFLHLDRLDLYPAESQMTFPTKFQEEPESGTRRSE